MKCKDCFFFEDRGDKDGFCHRYPPQVTSSFDTHNCRYRFEFPIVNEETWCGEFKEKDKTSTK